jgi:plastocyanin
VSLLVSGAPAGAQFRWSWTAPADGRHDSGAVPGTTIRPLAPGVQRVTVRVLSAGDPQNVTLTLSVAPPISSGAHARRRDRPHVRGESPRLRKRAGTDDRPSIATVAARTHSLAPPARAEHTGRDPAVTIADFRFTPATITVHVGDTVTWTNHGPSPHTATASDGSFNTGVLNNGQSASHTFTKPGTFTYTCQIHPFMHGTVVVLAAAGTPSTGSLAGSTSAGGGGHSTAVTTTSAASTPAATPATSQPTLPATGANIILVALAGLLLGVAGICVRVALAQPSSE